MPTPPFIRAVDGTIREGRNAAPGPDWSQRLLTPYFTTRTLTPFAVYCAVAGAASLIKFG
jgi:hypothetical protein